MIMAATVVWRYYYDAGPSDETATNLIFKLADNNTQDENNPCVRPAAGTNYSYWKTVALYATVAPSTGINNVKIYSEGAGVNWTGCVLQIGDETTAVYDQATGAGNSGDEMVANHSQITGKTAMSTYTSGSPKSVSGSIGAATGRISDYVVFQLDITNTASGGLQGTKTLTFQYDET
jgi:hypothetical protein